jgi:hypothetical protein
VTQTRAKPVAELTEGYAVKRVLLLSTLVTLVTLGAAVASPSSAQNASPGVGGEVVIGRFGGLYSDSGDAMAKSLARFEGISLAEARRRLVLQHEGSVLADKLSAAYGDSFAGAMSERTLPGYVRFYFVGVDLAKIRDALPGFGVSADLLPLVRLKAAAETEAQVRATATRMTQALRAGGVAASVATSMLPGGYKIFTRDPAKAAAALRRAGIQPASKVEFERADPIVIITD